MPEKVITVDSNEIIQKVLGNYDENVIQLRRKYGVNIVTRNGNIKIIGEEPGLSTAAETIQRIVRLARGKSEIDDREVRYVSTMVANGEGGSLSELDDNVIGMTVQGKAIRARTLGQKKYINLIEKNTITFGIGPAGTGKTYLAVAMAARAFRAHTVDRIILTRPAVEAGERLGFLPGDLQQKVDPYLRPLYDALGEMFGSESFHNLMDRGIIEVAPLAYMRGRTLENAFIILDEAQNTTSEQLKMFLTRLGLNSKMVITGDITQIDLPENKRSGLVLATRILRGIDDISIFRFTEKDVVRHRLVQDIIAAYAKFSKKE